MTYHKWSLVIMRAQPFHRWHRMLLERALQATPNVLLVLGSQSDTRTARNPFLANERRAQVRACYPYAKRLVVAAARDMPGEDVSWREQVESIFESVTGKPKGLLVANCKEGEDYLPRIFEGWDQRITNHNYEINATQIREKYFAGDAYAKHVPRPVWIWLEAFRKTNEYQRAFDAYHEGHDGAA